MPLKNAIWVYGNSFSKFLTKSVNEEVKTGGRVERAAVQEQELLFQFTQQSNSRKNWSFLPRAAILQKEYSAGEFLTGKPLQSPQNEFSGTLICMNT